MHVDPQPPVTAIDLRTRSGWLRLHRQGPELGPLTLCVPGLTANSRSFDVLGALLARAGRRTVALDLRGRGRSDITRAGTYGWRKHARDVLAVADTLGVERFDWVGHSMGAFVGLQACALAPHRIERLVLLDAAGAPDKAVAGPIMAAVGRLGAVYPSAEAYLAAVRALGSVEPWHPAWEEHYRYELVEAAGGVTPRTHKPAVLEDLLYGSLHRAHTLWKHVRARCLLVRATRPLGGGFVVPEVQRDAFLAQVPGAEVVEVDANHYGVMTHPATAEAVTAFLTRAPAAAHGTPCAG